MSLQKSHLQDLELIEKSILDVPVNLRDHTSMTVVINKKSILKAKELIRLFQDRFAQDVEVDQGEDVYKLSVSFYPLTKVTNKRSL